MTKLLTTNEVGERLHLHRNDVQRLIQQGRLRAVRLVVRGSGKRKRLRVTEDALRQFVEELEGAGSRSARTRQRRSRVGLIEIV